MSTPCTCTASTRSRWRPASRFPSRPMRSIRGRATGWSGREVFPRVAARVPGARLLIAGRRPPPDVRALAGNGITVLADVPDIREIYERCAVLAFPGELGRGAKNTVLEAMVMGRAVVAS